MACCVFGLVFYLESIPALLEQCIRVQCGYLHNRDFFLSKMTYSLTGRFVDNDSHTNLPYISIRSV